MPSPVTPSTICGAIVSGSSLLCEKFKTLLDLPKILCTFWTWAFNANGTFTPAFKAELASVTVPIGLPLPWLLPSGVPTGYVILDGHAVSRTTYSELFSVYGTTFGVGDGSTTFNLPDLQGVVFAGASGTHPCGSTAGAETVTLVAAQVQNHTHIVNTEDRTDGSDMWGHFDAGGESPDSLPGKPINPSATYGNTFTRLIAASGGTNSPVSVLQPTRYGYWITRAQTL